MPRFEISANLTQKVIKLVDAESIEEAQKIADGLTQRCFDIYREVTCEEVICKEVDPEDLSSISYFRRGLD